MQDFAETAVVNEAPLAPRQRVQTGESLVVLTRDVALAQSLKALGSEHRIRAVRGETELASELIGRQTGVAIIDASALCGPVGHLTERLKSQFPDLVLIVAGGGEDQGALAAQITNGTVYRFLHKPVSAQRVKLFVDAAWRRHGEELSGTAAASAETGVPPDQQTPLARNILWPAAALLVLLAIAGGWFMTRTATPGMAPNVPTVPLSAAPRNEQHEVPPANDDRELLAGTVTAPPGENAADVYKQALRRIAKEREARERERELSAQAQAAAAETNVERGAEKPDNGATADVPAPQALASTALQQPNAADMSSLERDITAELENSPQSAETVNAGSLELAHYSAPVFPLSARERGVSGWVDVQFLVKQDGAVSDVTITSAEPVGMFEQAAIDAVRKWRYKPMQRDGHAVDQHARLRMKFALDK